MISSSTLLQLGSYPVSQLAAGIILIVTWGKTTTPHCERSDSITEGVTYLHSHAVNRSQNSIYQAEITLQLRAYPWAVVWPSWDNMWKWTLTGLCQLSTSYPPKEWKEASIAKRRRIVPTGFALHWSLIEIQGKWSNWATRHHLETRSLKRHGILSSRSTSRLPL